MKYGSGNYPSSCLYLKTLSCLFFKTQRFGDWILSPSSDKTYSVEPNRYSQSLSPDSRYHSGSKKTQTATPSSVDRVGKFVFLMLVPYEVFLLSSVDFYRDSSLLQGLTRVDFLII
jgi:hypothetical protein